MTSGLRARIAEVVVNNYRIRNHLVDFVMYRSRLSEEGRGEDAADEADPPEVRPGLADGEPVPQRRRHRSGRSSETTTPEEA